MVADPWRPGALAAVADALRGDTPAHAVLIGSGPTAVDVALTLCGEAPGASVTLVSRHGRLPFAHLPGLRAPAPPPILPAGPLRLRTLERVLRAHVAQAERAGYDWRDAVDGLRPLVPRLWAALPDADRRAFADGANRAWEIRRHRLAPAVAAELAGLRRAGRLRVVRGAVAGVDARLTVRSASGAALRADAVVACAGPGRDVRAAQPLLRGLLADGHASADALGLGLGRRPTARCSTAAAAPTAGSGRSAPCAAASCGSRPRCASCATRRRSSRRGSARRSPSLRTPRWRCPREALRLADVHNDRVRISAKVDYAMRALVELAANGDGSPVTAERLAEAQGIPQKFLQNILLELRRAGIVASHRGPDGGHVLAKAPDKITVADVIRAVDGPLGSVAGRAPEDMEYQGSTKRLRDTWVAVRASVRSVLEGITLEDIASDHLPPSIANLLDGTDAWVRR